MTAVFRPVAELTPEQSRELHRGVTVGDDKTPTCPSCGVKRVKRQGPQKSFRGCVNTPVSGAKFGSAELSEGVVEGDVPTQHPAGIKVGGAFYKKFDWLI